MQTTTDNFYELNESLMQITPGYFWDEERKDKETDVNFFEEPEFMITENGLWKDRNPYSVRGLAERLEELMTPQVIENQERMITAYTGRRGMEEFNRVLRQQVGIWETPPTGRYIGGFDPYNEDEYADRSPRTVSWIDDGEVVRERQYVDPVSPFIGYNESHPPIMMDISELPISTSLTTFWTPEQVEEYTRLGIQQSPIVWRNSRREGTVEIIEEPRTRRQRRRNRTQELTEEQIIEQLDQISREDV